MNHYTTDNTLEKPTLAPQAVGTGATVNGAGVDCAGYEAAKVKVHMGAIVDSANVSVTVKLQESSDNGVADAFADITGATTGAILNAGQNEIYLFDVNLSERERYIRAVATGGSSGGGLVEASVELAGGRHLPPTQDNTVISVQ